MGPPGSIVAETASGEAGDGKFSGSPAFIHTPGTESALADTSFRSDVIERIAALHRIGEPMEVAGAAVFLASPAASLIMGKTILIDGGWTAR